MHSRSLFVAAVLAACLLVADARQLRAEKVGTVELVKDSVYPDILGGVPPLKERIEATEKQFAPYRARIDVEDDCRKRGDDECKELIELKDKQDTDKLFKDAEKSGKESTIKVVQDGKEKDVKVIIGEKKDPKDDEIKVPCRTSVWRNWLLGTICLPETTYDKKPEPKKVEPKKEEPKKEGDKKNRRRFF